MNLSVFGLGKLGAPLAAVLADAGHAVIGVDQNHRTIAAINNLQAPVDEPGLQELLGGCLHHLQATTDLNYAVHNSDVSFIVVPTPSYFDGSFIATTVLDLAREISRVEKSDPHVVVVVSTVSPGTMGTAVRAAVKGTKTALAYSPEFIALGSVIHDLQHPDFILIGSDHSATGDLLEEIYRSVCPFDLVVGSEPQAPPIIHTSIIDAELAKIALNSFVTMKISFANQLAEICEGYSGASATAVTNAIGYDSRIGHKYLRPGLAFGGPCFPRDSRAFARAAERVGAKAHLAHATDRVNHEQIGRIAGKIAGMYSTVSVLGLSYKAGSNVIEESAGLALLRMLQTKLGIDAVGYDENRDVRLCAHNSSACPVVQSLDIAMAREAVVVVNDAPEYLARAARHPAAIDATGRLDRPAWRIGDA